MLRNIPIKRKLTIISMLTSSVALLLTCGVIVGFEIVNFRRGMEQELLTIATIAGDNSAAALTFDDPSAAELTLRSLAADTHINAAFIYDSKGQPFASYQPPVAATMMAPPVPSERNLHRFDNNDLEIFRDITVAGETVGTIYLRHDMLELRAYLVRSGYLSLGAMVAASLVAFLLTRKLLPMVAGPIMALGQVVRDVAARKDFSIRAEKWGEDEVGSLIDGFNEMLGEVQHRDAALQAAQDSLEKRVDERTEELASSLSVLNATLESTADGILAVNLSGQVVCHNTKFAVMWGISSEMLTRRDGNEMVAFIAAQTHKPEEFMRKVDDIARRKGEQDSDVIELTDGRTFERYVQPQSVGGENVGIVVNFRDVTLRKRAEADLAESARQLLETSRQAGMAEVATSVLHNVGNVLNSVNVSCSVVAEKVRKSRVGSVGKTAALLHRHAGDLAAFFTTDPNGRKLPDYLGKLAAGLAQEQEELLQELRLLGRNVDHIKDIVAMQQNYAKVSGVMETLAMSDLIEDSLRMNDGSLIRHSVEVVRDYGEVPQITVEKHKALQILVNLIGNAKQACDDSDRADKKITFCLTQHQGRIRVSVIDNGVGISPENLTRIFAHGFTTKPDGHGFGLHSGALAAREMGGSLIVHSDGLGTGATFTLELPLGGSHREPLSS
ncbi:MAG: ATP-binding protein [Luteolibacter sp.]